MSELTPYVDTTPEVFTPPPAKAETDSWIPVIAEVAKLAAHIADTEFVPKGLRGSAPATAAAIIYGREVGLPPMTALAMTDVVEGRPSIRAEAMRAMIFAAGHEIEVTESTGAICSMRGRRRGSTSWSAPVTWTIDAARQAGLGNKNNWKNYPRQMLQARCTAELARLVFPDVIHGFAAVEELQDADDTQPAAGGTTTRKIKRSGGRSSKPTRTRNVPEPVGSDRPPLPGEQDTGEAAQTVRDTKPSPAGDTAPENKTGAAFSGGDASPASPPPSDLEDDPDQLTLADTTDSADASDGDGDDGPDLRKATKAQTKMLFARLNTIGIRNDEDDGGIERRFIASKILDREIESFADLTRHDMGILLDTLAKFTTPGELWAFLDAFPIPADQVDQAEHQDQDEEAANS